MINLKRAFTETEDRDHKIKILTVLPQNWSYNKIKEHFYATTHMITTAKECTREEREFSAAGNEKCRESLLRKTSSIKNYARKNGMKGHVQKRLILSNLKELNSHLICVCVCTIHQNIKLMIDFTGIPELTEKDYFPIKTYQDCVARVICNPPLPSFYVRICYECPGTMKIREQLQEAFEMALVDNLIYSQWVSVVRTTPEIFQKEVPECIDDFLFKLTSLKNHGFIAQQQQLFFRKMKNSVTEGEYVVVCAFSENYAFVLQDEAPGFHWNNNQETVHPFVIYGIQEGKVTCKSFVCISECVKDDTVAVHLFQNSRGQNDQQNIIRVVMAQSKILTVKPGSEDHFKRTTALPAMEPKEEFQTYG
ncbi:hypothetical protein J437_LFUL003357 [Ladona fulva]|uniref:Uncharacterized protein n=1 Tax=Ladona fulva TaxID=123851 RepID=A0A8K0JYS1_LADFU|nr:hypothetical protein J437_LFUL003357 [Ladona fulva]